MAAPAVREPVGSRTPVCWTGLAEAGMSICDTRLRVSLSGWFATRLEVAHGCADTAAQHLCAWSVPVGLSSFGGLLPQVVGSMSTGSPRTVTVTPSVMWVLKLQLLSLSYTAKAKEDPTHRIPPALQQTDLGVKGR